MRFARRILGAVLLDAHTYEEVEADRRATPQACGVVLLSAAGAGIGAFATLGWEGLLWNVLHALALWVAWALVTWAIGTRLLPGPHTRSDPGELLRTIGFSSAPGMLRALGVVPALAGPVYAIATAWMLVAMVIAVRQALDYRGTGRAIAVCAVGFPVYALGLGVSVLLLGPWPI